MTTDKRHRDLSYFTTAAWLVTKGLRSGKLHIAKVISATALAVIELSVLFWLTSGMITFLVASITFVLFVLAISEVMANAVQRRKHRVTVLMAFGAKRRLIAMWLLIESAIGSLLGSLIGSMMGLIVIYFFSLSAGNMTPQSSSMILPFSLGFVFGLIACIFPQLKIMELSISESH